MSEKIKVSHLTKVFGDDPEAALSLLREGKNKDEILEETGMTVGVQDANFTVDEGEIFVVMGLSGSGKSTLVRMLNRLIPATEGEIEIGGTDILEASDEELRRLRLKKMAMVFQHFALFPHKSVAENVEYGLKVQGVGRDERRDRALQALDRVGLKAWADRRPDALSGGMQQRVGLARGLAVDPEILLMDEPFSALDPLIRRDMQAELLELQRELKKTIVFITHDLHEALILGDHIAIMKDGRLVQTGTAEEIVGTPADDYVEAFTKDIDRSKVFSAHHVMVEAEPIDPEKEDAEDALERMEKLGRDALYVLDGKAPAGIVTYRELAALKREKGAGVSEAMRRDFPTAGPDELLWQLYIRCAGGVPVAVVEDDGELVGVAYPDDILEKLAQGRREDEDGADARAAA